MGANAGHPLFRTRNNRSSRDDDRYKTYRVKTTLYKKGGGTRKYTDLFPANSDAEAESQARKKHPNDGGSGYSFDVKKVSDFWREYE